MWPEHRELDPGPRSNIVEPPLYSGDSFDCEESDSLHSALESGSLDMMIQRLLDRGADVNERDELLQTPLDVASRGLLRCTSRRSTITSRLYGGPLSGEQMYRHGVCMARHLLNTHYRTDVERLCGYCQSMGRAARE